MAAGLGTLLLITLLQLLYKTSTARGAAQVRDEGDDDIPELALYNAITMFELRGSVL
jgi:hypothetical protein